MLRKIRHILVIIILLPLLSGCLYKDNVKKLVLAAKETSELSTNFFKVTKVVDGDTIDVNYFGKTERIRMIGINTPESVDPRRPVECFGKEAAAEARKLLLNKLVSLEADETQDDRDKYGRLLRYVKIKDGGFYNQDIIKNGFAYEYTYKVPYEHQKDFKKAQADAQSHKRGLWADTACGLKNNNKSASSTPVITGSKASSTSIVKNGLCSIKGNISANKKKTYHLVSCPDYQRTVIDPKKGERFFCTESEAQKNGFKKAKNCK